MRRGGIVHAQLAAALAGLRHTDLWAVSDCGLPVPRGVEVVDLAVSYGLPAFEPVLRAVLAEVVVEASWAAAPVAEHNPGCLRLLQELLPAPELISHEALKEEVGACRFVLRTGEATPYANVLLRAGVPFG